MEQILQNKDGLNKIFIDSELVNDENFIIEKLDVNVYNIRKKDNSNFNVIFENESISIDGIDCITYMPTLDYLKITNSYESTLMKTINEIEIIGINGASNTIRLNVFKLPMFLCNDSDENYPKFELNISDCIYNMKIYLNEIEYIDIPYTQTHSNIIETLGFITEIVKYLTNENKEFIGDLCNNNKIDISIYTDDKEFMGSGIYEYELATNGIVLMHETFSEGMCVVDWYKFFSLILNKDWICKF